MPSGSSRVWGSDFAAVEFNCPGHGENVIKNDTKCQVFDNMRMKKGHVLELSNMFKCISVFKVIRQKQPPRGIMVFYKSCWNDDIIQNYLPARSLLWNNMHDVGLDIHKKN